MKNKISFLLLFTLLTVFSACNNNEDNPDPCSISFDEELLFTNYAFQIIVPAYQDLDTKMSALNSSVRIFSSSPSLSSLSSLQDNWRQAYLSYQEVALYNFGPAENAGLRSTLNNFPVDVSLVNDNINNGSWDLDTQNTFDKGFPALDYLFFGTGMDQQAIVDYFLATPNARNYASDLIDQMTEIVKSVFNEWTQNGYRETFIANTGKANGSSLSLLVNSLCEDYELLQQEKIGNPAGILTSSTASPQDVEAFYSGISLNLLNLALINSEKVFNGDSGPGLDDYLDEVGADVGGLPLTNIIRSQFQEAKTAVAAINNPLSDALNTQAGAVQTAHTALLMQVENLRTEMASSLCVTITY